MFQVTLVFVISTCVYFTASNGVVQNFKDFSILGCSEFRNVTFISLNDNINNYEATFDHHFFLQGLNDLLDNEACFMVNYFDGFDIVRLRKNYNINQFQFRTKHKYSRYENEVRRFAELIKQLYDEKIMGNDENIKQTIVLIQGFNRSVADEILAYLELLQEERQWAVIVFRIYTYYKPIDWLPLNRNIETMENFYNGVSMQHPAIKTLFDVIKNPDFDVYDMTYRLVVSKTNFFTDDCMKEIRKIFVTVVYMKFTYVPMASAILRKVNNHRSKVNQEPLEIHFSSKWKGMKQSSDGHLSKTEFNWRNHPLIKGKNKRHVYILILTGDEWWHCPQFIEKQDLYYRQFLPKRREECFGDVNAKTFETGEELFEHINYDLCKK
eukprot:TCONS_00062131-protein